MRSQFRSNKFDVRVLVLNGTNLIVGTSGSGVFLSTNDGTSWAAINYALTNTNVNALTINNKNLFAGVDNRGRWRRLLSEMITSVKGFSIDLPIGFVLIQNYPNPFNSAMTIQYFITQRSNVLVKGYDILGNEITKLVNEEKEQGVYTINFSAIV